MRRANTRINVLSERFAEPKARKLGRLRASWNIIIWCTTQESRSFADAYHILPAVSSSVRLDEDLDMVRVGRLGLVRVRELA